MALFKLLVALYFLVLRLINIRFKRSKSSQIV